MTNYVVSSGVISGISLHKTGTMSVFDTGVSKDISINGTRRTHSGGSEVVYGGEIARGTMLKDFGSLTVSAGGFISDTFIDNFGVEIVISGGIQKELVMPAMIISIQMVPISKRRFLEV